MKTLLFAISFLLYNSAQAFQYNFADTVGWRNNFYTSYPSLSQENLDVGTINNSSTFNFDVLPFMDKSTKQALCANGKVVCFYDNSILKCCTFCHAYSFPNWSKNYIKNTSDNINESFSDGFKTSKNYGSNEVAQNFYKFDVGFEEFNYGIHFLIILLCAILLKKIFQKN